MRPLSLKGHDRPLTRVRINTDGDLLFTSAKDKSPCVWYLENGERIGTYDGHNGVVWDIDVSFDTKHFCSASGDNNVKLWDCEIGRTISTIATTTASRSISLSYSGYLLGFTTIQMMQNNASLRVFDIRDGGQMSGKTNPLFLEELKTQANNCVWTHLDDMICIGNEKGHLVQFDVRKKDKIMNDQAHKLQINDMQSSFDQCFLITASKDKSAKLFNASTLECVKTYKSERPVNSAAVSPNRDHIILGGGEEAMKVTQTTASSAHFEAKLYHKIYEEEFAKFKGHFGPINSIAFFPNGAGVVTGGEDGYARIQEFDDDYLNFDYDF